jgi:glucose-1-phosphate thymidylyltransferase
MTLAASKQLLPIYDKPMIYYPLATLMLAGICDILVISTPHDLPMFQRLLRDGAQFGVRLSYAAQPMPDGIAQAFHIAADWIAGGACALALGDNVIFGARVSEALAAAARRALEGEATVFGYRVTDPQRYGVVEFDEGGRVLSIEEKPGRPRSDWAVIGLYFYDRRVCELAGALRPSARGELEITDLNKAYLDVGALHAEQLGRGCAWFDAGVPRALLQASQFVQVMQERQGLQVGCPEEVGFRLGFLDAARLRAQAASLGQTAYGRYLTDLADGKHN